MPHDPYEGLDTAVEIVLTSNRLGRERHPLRWIALWWKMHRLTRRLRAIKREEQA